MIIKCLHKSAPVRQKNGCGEAKKERKPANMQEDGERLVLPDKIKAARHRRLAKDTATGKRVIAGAQDRQKAADAADLPFPPESSESQLLPKSHPGREPFTRTIKKTKNKKYGEQLCGRFSAFFVFPASNPLKIRCINA